MDVEDEGESGFAEKYIEVYKNCSIEGEYTITLTNADIKNCTFDYYKTLNFVFPTIYDQGTLDIDLRGGRTTIKFEGDKVLAFAQTMNKLTSSSAIWGLAEEPQFKINDDGTIDLDGDKTLDVEMRYDGASIFFTRLSTCSVVGSKEFKISKAAMDRYDKNKTKYYSAINFMLPGSAVVEPILVGSDKGEYVLDLTSGSATENDRIKANDLARYFQGLIEEGKIGSSGFPINPKMNIDLDKDGSYDILQTWINSRMGGIDSFTFTTLSTNSVKGSITLAISNEKLRSIMEGGSDTYSKVTFVFEKPGTPASAEQDAAKVADAANGHKVGDKVSNGGATYTITSVEDGKQAVTYVKPDAKDVKNAVIPDAINIDGTDYKVTEIAAGAFKNNKKLKKATIGSNIKKIDKDAYKGCKNLKSIKIKTVLLTKKSVGSGAFKNIHKAAKCKVPKKVLKNYQKFLIKKGLNGKGQKITK